MILTDDLTDFYEINRDIMIGYLVNRGCDHYTAEDIIQNVFYEVLNKDLWDKIKIYGQKYIWAILRYRSATFFEKYRTDASHDTTFCTLNPIQSYQFEIDFWNRWTINHFIQWADNHSIERVCSNIARGDASNPSDYKNFQNYRKEYRQNHEW